MTSGAESIRRFVESRSVQKASVYQIPNSTWIEFKYVFGEKNIVDFSGETFKIGVLDKRNFDCTLNNETLSGFSADIIKTLEELLNFKAEFVEIDLHDHQNVDLIACHPNVIPSGYVELRSTFISEYIKGGKLYSTGIIVITVFSYAFVYKPSNLHFTKDIFILTFVGTLWLCFLIMFVALAFCLRISTIQYSRIHRDTRKWNWVEITLWAIAAPCQQGFSYTPKYFGSCLIFFIGYLTAYLLYTGFAAAITSVLLGEDNTELKLAHLDNINIVLYGRNDFHPYRISKEVDSVRKIFEEIERRHTVGLCPKILIDEVTVGMLKQFACTSLQNVLKYRVGFVLNEQASRLLKPINREISRMEQSGLIHAILNRNLRRTEMDRIFTGYSSAGFEHVASAIYIFLAGVVISVVFLIFELCFHLYKKYKFYKSHATDMARDD